MVDENEQQILVGPPADTQILVTPPVETTVHEQHIHTPQTDATALPVLTDGPIIAQAGLGTAMIGDHHGLNDHEIAQRTMRDRLGIYANEEILQDGSKTIALFRGNANLGINVDTGETVVRDMSANIWLSPGQPDYDRVLAQHQGVDSEAARRLLLEGAALQMANANPHDDFRPEVTAAQQEVVREDLADVIGGKGISSFRLEQDLVRLGELGVLSLGLKGVVAEDMPRDFEIGTDFRPDSRVAGEGADQAYAYAQERKREKNEAFMAESLQRQKKLDDSNA